jgi:hypothetical protein
MTDQLKQHTTDRLRESYEQELADANRHVKQLERINKALAEECDRLRRENGETDSRPN